MSPSNPKLSFVLFQNKTCPIRHYAVGYPADSHEQALRELQMLDFIVVLVVIFGRGGFAVMTEVVTNAFVQRGAQNLLLCVLGLAWV